MRRLIAWFRCRTQCGTEAGVVWMCHRPTCLGRLAFNMERGIQ